MFFRLRYLLFPDFRRLVKTATSGDADQLSRIVAIYRLMFEEFVNIVWLAAKVRIRRGAEDVVMSDFRRTYHLALLIGYVDPLHSLAVYSDMPFEVVEEQMLRDRELNRKQARDYFSARPERLAWLEMVLDHFRQTEEPPAWIGSLDYELEQLQVNSTRST